MATLQDVLRFLRVEHTVFSLPFIYIGILMAPVNAGVWVYVWATMAGLGARGTAMALNRIIDRAVDAANPRTAMRELPAGRMGLGVAMVLTLAFLGLYVTSTHLLNPLVFRLSAIPLVAFIIYPYLKRFTWLCHLFLGFTLGFAPTAGWLAATGVWADLVVPVLLSFAVLCWVAGFDIIYALLDVRHDREHGIHSAPADLGVASARTLAAILHVAMVALLGVAGYLWAPDGFSIGAGVYALGVLAIAGMLLYQHRIVDPASPASIGKAAFTVNGIAGFVLLAAVAGAVWLGPV